MGATRRRAYSVKEAYIIEAKHQVQEKREL